MINLFLKKHHLWIVLAIASTIIYSIDYLIIGNSKDVVSSLLGNLGFLPIYVIFVTLMVEQIMKERERQTIMRKLNMVIGVFFSEVGNQLLKGLTQFVVMEDELQQELHVTGQWQEKDFNKALQFLQSHEPEIVSAGCNKQQIKDFLLSKRTFLIGLLENQNLLEHEDFTDLLWAVFHLLEELDARKLLEGLPQTDVEHINGDIKRVFGYLSRQWVFYMFHLKQDYPYLFSLAIRLNPMVSNPDPIIY
ncbi:MAG TPA: hypothetical protein VGJ93_02650 [Desulfuromonadaceae bacterium]|jgi:hypothetical protein